MILLLACHFMGDFSFQPEFIASGKGKSWELNLYHALIYVATFFIFAKVSLLFGAILFITHFLIDPLKDRWKLIKTIWFDQIIHIFIIITLWCMII